MPEELTPEQHDELVAVLRQLATQLGVNQAASAGHAIPVELDQTAVGRVSRIDAIQQQQMAAEVVRRTETRLKVVKLALKAADEGEYGWCRKCGEPIGYGRLKARPESPCCVECTAAIGG